MGSRPDTPRLNSFWNELSQRKGSALLAGAWLLATAVASAEPKTQARATFAGGCFWSVEAAFDNTAGPIDGYVTLPTGPGLGFTPKSGILDLAVE